MTKLSIFRYEGHNYLVPFLIISSLFFMWGFAHGILEVLNPHFQESFHISKAMSALTQAAVYGAYFLMALPAGWIIRKWGYRRGVITGLVLFGIGALMFIPGSRINSFYFFVLSLFVIGCGLTCLETSANPYTTVLGHPDKAESRINLSLPSPRPFQKGKGCNRTFSVLGTATLYGWRTIKGLRHVMRDGTAGRQLADGTAGGGKFIIYNL